MCRNPNLVLSWASGEKHCRSEEFNCFLNSLRENIKYTNKRIFTHDMPEDVADRIMDMRAFKIVDIPEDRVDYLARDRFLAFWDYLVDFGHKFEYVLVCDSRDVIFQRNPFEWIEKWKERYSHIAGKKNFLNNFVILSSEGMRWKQSGFALIEQFEFQRDVPKKFLCEDRSEWVVNSGIMMGTPNEIKNLCFLIWVTQMKTIGQCTDQACLNYLWYFLKEDETYRLSHPFNNAFCLTGEGVKEGFVNTEFIDGQFVLAPNKVELLEDEQVRVWENEDREPYYIVHQWDRLDFKEEILAQYSK